jgi:hypothetical protein
MSGVRSVGGEGMMGVGGRFASTLEAVLEVFLVMESCQGWVTSALQTGHWNGEYHVRKMASRGNVRVSCD